MQPFRLMLVLLPWCLSAVLVALWGLFVILDAIYWHPDPQSAIGIVLTPFFHEFGFLIARRWRGG